MLADALASRDNFDTMKRFGVFHLSLCLVLAQGADLPGRLPSEAAADLKQAKSLLSDWEEHAPCLGWQRIKPLL